MKRSDQQSFLEGLGVGLGSATSTASSFAASTAAFTSQASFSIASSARSGINAVGNMSFMNRGQNIGSNSSTSGNK